MISQFAGVVEGRLGIVESERWMRVHADIVRTARIGTMSVVPVQTFFRRVVASVLGFLVLAFLVLVFLVLATSTVAHAHTDFDYSLPADGASVDVAVEEITVAFTLPVELVRNGFEVLDPQGNVLEPLTVTDDDIVFRLQFDPPLVGGTVAVKYEVRAEDGHVLSGNFVFDVKASATTTTPTAAPTVVTTPTTRSTGASTTAGPPTTAATVARPTTTVPTPIDETGAATEVDDARPSDDTADDSGSGSGVVIAIAIAVALGIAGFLVRSRTSGAT